MRLVRVVARQPRAGPAGGPTYQPISSTAAAASQTLPLSLPGAFRKTRTGAEWESLHRVILAAYSDTFGFGGSEVRGGVESNGEQ